ncbi:bifunctional heptose 7-phosphate kinase/heptose 1-phosphate adenyltransferase [Gemmata sp. SH-PL17]|uniref:bifunctional heptose 7-phosphate kinase/heptose 1-phosphate adenyltransferase n=1 Tax=Gemmata sp. SH-PL17 TaxID=1630693 RepID=UPI00078DD737|nr:PfkB family carbohydrate kinase [Gemmata sp. SH-PL17]AMV23371.1 bifunctional heptose 7-phosphate kinase/heptose 1-phosphate adenyltransferase [Gemmata sp. SH-PL17]
MLTSPLIDHILATIPNRTIGVLGDLFLDRYLDIDPALNEPSVETGLTAYQVVGVRSYPGAAGTVINNLAALGVGHIYPIACIGDDGEGYELRQALGKMPAVEQGGIFLSATRRTPTYTKPMLGKEELNRLDIKNRAPTPEDVQDRVIALLDEAWPRLDALLVLDQVSEKDCGVVTRKVRDHLARLAERDPAKFVLADSREQIGLFRNVCVKPNWDELIKLDPVAANTVHKAAELGPRLAADVKRHVFQTSGKSGIALYEPTVAQRWLSGASIALRDCFQDIPAYPVSGPIDICGAGDSCSAGIASGMVSGTTHEQAAAFGNLVASITIQQIGVTGTAPPELVRKRWSEVNE